MIDPSDERGWLALQMPDGTTLDEVERFHAKQLRRVRDASTQHLRQSLYDHRTAVQSRRVTDSLYDHITLRKHCLVAELQRRGEQV